MTFRISYEGNYEWKSYVTPLFTQAFKHTNMFSAHAKIAQQIPNLYQVKNM